MIPNNPIQFNAGPRVGIQSVNNFALILSNWLEFPLGTRRSACRNLAIVSPWYGGSKALAERASSEFSMIPMLIPSFMVIVQPVTLQLMVFIVPDLDGTEIPS